MRSCCGISKRENAQLKKLLAESILDAEALKVASSNMQGLRR
jgi:hypothetical protein